MKGLNLFTIAGNLVKAPTIETYGEYTVAKFTVAVNESLPVKKPEGGYRYEESVTYRDVEAWGANASYIKAAKLDKGSAIIVHGRLTTQEYDGKQGIRQDDGSWKATKTRREVLVADTLVIASNGTNNGEKPVSEIVLDYVTAALVKLNGEDMHLTEFASKLEELKAQRAQKAAEAAAKAEAEKAEAAAEAAKKAEAKINDDLPF